MLKRQINLSLTFLILVLALIPKGFADEGFYPMNHSKVSAKIRDISRSVYHLVFFDLSDLAINRGRILSSYRYEEALSNLNQSLRVIQNKNLKVNLLVERAQVLWCQENNMHTCIVFSPKYFCSSSLFGDNKTLLTAAHCLVEVTKENVNQKMNEPLSLMVLDGNGKLLVHSLPTNSSDRSTLLLWGPNYQRNEFSEIKKTIKETQTDFALIRLPTTLPGTPFIFSKDDTVEKDSQIISLGFPGPTNGRRENYQALDSDGVNVVASFGFFLGTSKDNPELRAFLGSELIGPRLPESASPIEQYAFIFDHTWISDMDCHQGMSGGPVINENGKLIGVVSRELLAMSNTGREISSSMARPMASISVKLKEYASVLDLISSQEKDQEMHIPRIVIVGETLPHIDLQNIPRELRKAGDPMADIAPITRDTNFSRNR